MAGGIPNREIYRTVAAEDLGAHLEPERYVTRSSAFDAIIAAAESHYWNPEDPRYIEFDQPFGLDEQLILPPEFTPELLSAVADRLDERQRIAFGNEIARFNLSQSLHGEKAGVSICGQLCMIFGDAGAQEYATNQAREESRHVRALSKYIGSRWGAPLEVGDGLGRLLTSGLTAPEVYKKIIGMQIMVEGIALGVFSAWQASTADPVLARLLRLIMTDEAYHHRFGQLWGLETVPRLNEEQHREVETWAAGCFLTMMQNLLGAAPKKALYERFGLDPQWVAGAMAEIARPGRPEVFGGERMFGILVKTLARTGIVTSRTRSLYRTWFDLDALASAPDDSTDRLISETTAELSELNRDLHSRVRRP
jgi:hypothetical protein